MLFLPSALCWATSFNDWQKVSRHQNKCGGVYIPPFFEQSEVEAQNLPIVLFSDQTELEESGSAKLTGDVILRYGVKEIRADSLFLKRRADENTLQSVQANGNILYSEPDVRIWGDDVSYDGLTQKIMIENAKFRYYPRHARGSAFYISLDQEKNINLHQATYTTCAPDVTTWLIAAKSIHLAPKKGRGVAKHLVFRVKDIPVLYMPYLDFPLNSDRKSGFLYPNFGTNNNSGSEVSVPYYWNMAPNYDATFTARVLSKRGVDFQTHFRYLTQYSNGALQFNILPDDRDYRAFRRENLMSPPRNISPSDPRISALTQGNHRFAVAYKHHMDDAEHWLFDVDYHHVGDDNYFIDLGNDLNVANTGRLLREAQIQYRGTHWRHLWRFQDHQVLHPLDGPLFEEEYRRQPQWAFHANFPDSTGGLTYVLDGEVGYFAHRGSVLTGLSMTEGKRVHVRPGVSLPFEREAGYFIPRVQWDILQYDLTLGAQDWVNNHPRSAFRTVPLWDVDSGLFFERKFKWQNRPFFQTLEPRLYYLYVPFREQNNYPNFDSGAIDFSASQLFRDNYFSGRDRIKDAHQLTVSMTSRFVDASGQEKLRATIGEIVSFTERQVTLCDKKVNPACQGLEDPFYNKPFSPIIGEIASHLIADWHVAGTLEWDPNFQKNEKMILSSYYQDGQNKLFNVSYYWLKIDPAQTNFTQNVIIPLEQADVSLVWPFARQWNFLGRYLYDVKRNRTVDFLGGVEWDGCCSAIQLIFSRYLKPNGDQGPNEYATGFFFQIVLKGLSSVGMNNVDDKLAQKIPGYSRFRERQSLL